MNRIHRSIFATVALATLLFVGLVVSPATAQEKEEIRTADYNVKKLTYPDLRDFKVPDPTRLELDNGMTIFLLEDHELPQINAVARIGVGSVYEPAKKRGLATITGTVMRTGGTASMSPDSLSTVLGNLGATVETNIGETSGTAYMSTLTENVDTVLPVYAQILREPAFAKKKIQQAKSQVKSSIARRNDSPSRIASREFEQVLYGEDSPYARTPEYYTVDRIKRQDLVNFHDQYFHPNNVILSVWGDFETQAMKKKLRKQFGDWTAPEDFTPPTPPKPSAERSYSVNVVPKSDVNQSTVRIGHIGEITRDHPDYAAVKVMNEVLGAPFVGRLFRKVRDELGLAYSVGASYGAGYTMPGEFTASVGTKSSTTVKATEAVMNEIKKMQKEAPTQKRIKRAKESYMNSFVFNFDAEREILGRRMAYESYDYPSDFLQQTKDAVEKVTPDDVLSVAKKYLHPEKSHILVVGNRKKFSDSLSALTKDGSVNTIDISIPTSPPGEKTKQKPVSAKAKAAGMKVLKKARSALGGDEFGKIKNIRIKGTRTMSRKGRTMSMDVTMVQAFPDQVRAEIKTPRGKMIMMVDGDSGTMKMGGRSRSMPSKRIKQQKASLWRSVPYLMANIDHEGLVVQDQGTKTVKGTTYKALKVSPPVGDPYTLYLKPESMRPARLSYTATTRKGPKDAASVFKKYKKVSGVMIPHKTVTYQGGKKAAEVTLKTVTINADLGEGLFSTSATSSKK
ncbi:MAG: M16 family metallopeptidase [Salinibacter sp.]|uniref:M16 family metallopeptidase n=1 Tax=Salinibacter sp. TaxID=2065818 RepID=UPI0035D4234F